MRQTSECNIEEAFGYTGWELRQVDKWSEINLDKMVVVVRRWSLAYREKLKQQSWMTVYIRKPGGGEK